MKSLEIDPLLQPYLDAADVRAAALALEHLVRTHINPVIEKVLRGHRSDTDSVEDREDLRSLALGKVVWALEQRRAGASEQPVADLNAYVARTTHNVFNDFVREKRPDHQRISYQLRYAFRNRPGLALWEGENGQEWCGFADWRRPGGPLASPRNRARLRSRPEEIIAHRLPGEDPMNANLIDLYESLLNEMQGAVPFDDLVAGMSAMRKETITRTQTESEHSDERPRLQDAAATPRDGIEVQVEHRGSLAFLWQEILELSLDQRAALLLKMDNIQLLPATGVATIGRIADALGIPRHEFYALWDTLPLEDRLIAARLGLDIQQVINRRSKARERLNRRMQAFH